MIIDLKIGEGLAIKLDKTYTGSLRNRWHEYATRNGMKVKTFKTRGGLLVVERIK